MTEFIITADDEKVILKALEKRTDPDALRIKRYLGMPDLSRTEGNPIKKLVERITAIPDFQRFDLVNVPEIVPTSVAFDLFDFAPDHPARSRSDTYFFY